MADQSELLQMMMDDPPTAATSSTDATQAVMPFTQNSTDEPSGAAPAQMDLTPVAVVQSTDLDKPAKQQGAAKKRQLKKAQDRDDKEREEAIRAVLGGDDEEPEDPRETEDKKTKKKRSSACSKAKGSSVTKIGSEKTKKAAKDDGEDSKKKKKQQQQQKQQQPKKKSDEEDGSVTPGTVRRQAGHAMIKAEYDRITRALDALVRKRVQREESNGGQAPTSVCGILINNLIEFYEQDVLVPFDRKFARYMN